jgi:hypothetical protein
MHWGPNGSTYGSFGGHLGLFFRFYVRTKCDKSEFDSTSPYDLTLFEWFLGHIRPTCTLPNLFRSALGAYWEYLRVIWGSFGPIFSFLRAHEVRQKRVRQHSPVRFGTFWVVCRAYKAYMYTTKFVQECIGGLLGVLAGHLGVIWAYFFVFACARSATKASSTALPPTIWHFLSGF